MKNVMKTQIFIPQFSPIIISFYYYYSPFKVIIIAQQRTEKAKESNL
jgi:hypothetical protein